MDCESKKNTDEYSGVETWGGGGWGKNENDEKNVTGFRLVHGVSMKRCPSQTEKKRQTRNRKFQFFRELFKRESSFNQRGILSAHLSRLQDNQTQSKGRPKPVLDKKKRSGNVCLMFLQGEEEYLPKTGGVGGHKN